MSIDQTTGDSPDTEARRSTVWRIVKNLLLGVTALVVALVALVVFSYNSFRGDRQEELRSGSEVIETRIGPVEYVLEGDGDQVVLSIHGTPGGYDQRFGLDGFQVLAPSRPGYLRTPISAGRTPREQADAYAALLDALSIDEVVIMGLSGGGPSSMTFAAVYPERTRALIALEAVSNSDLPDIPAPAFLAGDFTAWLSLSMFKRAVGTEGLLEMFSPDPENQRLVLESEEKTAAFEGLMWSLWPPSQRGDGLANDEKQFDALDLPLADIRVPTLAIHGTADAAVPVEHASFLADRVPQAQLHIIEGADHLMPVSHQEEVVRVITEFIDGLDDEADEGSEESRENTQ